MRSSSTGCFEFVVYISNLVGKREREKVHYEKASDFFKKVNRPLVEYMGNIIFYDNVWLWFF